MKFSYSWLQSYFKAKLPKAAELAELLSDHFANVEEVKKEGQDFLLDIEVRPNRAADCFGHWSVAREIAAILKLPLNLPLAAPKESKQEKASNFVAVKIEAPDACPRYAARVVSGVKVGPSPAWLRKRLEACGLQSINNIVDIANYVMLETNQPLHAFDWDKIHSSGKKKTILVRFARKGERLLALDDKAYDLAPGILVIADDKEPLAVAGIKGGKSSGIDQKTKTIILEGANFDPQTIRQASQRLKLKTDASWRFEHGLDPNLTELALNRASELVREVAGGQVAEGAVVSSSRAKIKPRKIRLKTALVNDLLGSEVSREEIKNILESLDFRVKTEGQSLLVEVPTRRLDVLLPEDLVEEVGRILGYKNITDRLPVVALSLPPKNKDVVWEEWTRDIFVRAGFSEVWNYSFSSEEAQTNIGSKKENLVELENPLDQGRPYLVSSLLPNLLANITLNEPYFVRNPRSGHFETIKIFELGKVFFKTAGRGVCEERRLAAVWGRPGAEVAETKAGTVSLEGFDKDNFGIGTLKGSLEFLLKEGGIKAANWRPAGDYSFLEKGKSFEISVGKIKLGFLGSLKAAQACLLEVDFEKLLPLLSENKTYQPLAKNPAAKRDLALLVPEKIRSAQVKKAVESQKPSFLIKMDLFDIYSGQDARYIASRYRGKELPGGKKSLAFRLSFQSPEKTLSTQELKSAMSEIIEIIKSNGWEARA